MKISAGILAGGKSSRMTRDKVRLEYNGQSFLNIVTNACREFDEIIISVNDKSRFGDVVYKIVEDERKEFGPLEGIYQLLKASANDYMIITAVDMPLIRKELFEAMAFEITGKEDCIVLNNDKRPQPLCSIYKKSVIPVLETMFNGGIHKPRILYDKVNTKYVEINELGFDSSIIMNVNTLDEYEDLRRKNFEGM